MAYTAEDFKRFQENVLGLDDKFRFTCTQCGDCCRKRDEAIIITGVDVFYIAKALNITPFQVIQQFTDFHVGVDSRVPVFTLRERLDGSCSLLRKGKCTVHKNKPVPCALYPLGRMIIGDADEYTYFKQDRVCGLGAKGEEHTLREWLDEFNLRQRDKEGILWMKMFSKFSDKLRKAEKDKDVEAIKKLVPESMKLLYVDFDISKDMYEQLKEHMDTGGI